MTKENLTNKFSPANKSKLKKVIDGAVSWFKRLQRCAAGGASEGGSSVEEVD
jgi:hypothetical protein